MNLSVIAALVLRYLFLYMRNPMRLIELIFWPLVDLMVWGYLTMFLQENTNAEFASFLSFLLGGLILWDVLFRAQQGVAISFLEDVWTRNLLNVFVAPVRTHEYVLATFVVGFLRIFITLLVMCSVAWIGFQFNIFQLQWSLIAFFLNLLIFGWSLGMISTALILRWGLAVESLAWAIPFFVQPLVCVFYPLAKLPAWMQPLAQALPATHVFEGMRDVLNPQIATFSWSHFSWALTTNLVFLVLAALIFAKMLRSTREQGLLTKIATQ